MTSIVTGFEIAATINAETLRQSSSMARPPCCTILLDKTNAGMNAYGERLRSMAIQAGIKLETESYPSNAADLFERITALKDDPAIDAVATLYPLLAGVDPIDLAIALGPHKDVDGLHPLNAGRLALGAPSRVPATAQACLLMAQELVGSLKGKNVTIIGASRIVGRPLAQMLLDQDATVSITHAATRELPSHTRQADIIITAAGVPKLLGADHITEGAIVIDVAINRTGTGLVGDADQAALNGIASAITHVPDGVGPITTACLFRNILEAAQATVSKV
jgi:methylenetetrahydrofolate dehydrogenase (NADP+) / methenyltetrahydrofolate cyclohydrolase